MARINQKELRTLLNELKDNQKTVAELNARKEQLLIEGFAVDSENVKLLQVRIDALNKKMCLNENGKVNFKKYLKNNGFDPKISKVSFFLPLVTVAKSHGVGESIFHAKDTLKNIDFRGCDFKNCDFNSVNVSGSDFSGCQLEQCKLDNTIFRGCKLQGATVSYKEQDNHPIVDCDFSNANCENMTVRNGTFQYATFYDTKLTNAKMPFTRFEQSTFVESNPQEMMYDQSMGLTFQDCAMAETMLTELEHMGYPIEDNGRQKVAIVWKANWPGHTAAKLLKYLKAQGITPIKVDYDPANINRELLNEDVQNLLAEVRASDSDKPVSQQIININAENPEITPEMSAMRKYAQGFISLSDGLMIPGGLDLEGELENKEYKPEEKHHTVHTEDDYARSILEIQLLAEQDKRGAPVMGVCRGAQMINLFYGGTSHEHIEQNVNVVQPLTALPETNGIISHIYNKQSQAGAGISFHHQAMDRIGDGLQEVIAVEQEIETPGGPQIQHVTKAAEGIYQQPILAIQYHPEVFTDAIYRDVLGEENPQLLNAFVDTVRAHQVKQLNVLSEIKKLGSTLGDNKHLKPSEIKVKQKEEHRDLYTQSHQKAREKLIQPQAVERIKKPKVRRNIHHSEMSALLKEIKYAQATLDEYQNRMVQLQEGGDPKAIILLEQEIAKIHQSLCMDDNNRIQFKSLLRQRGFNETIQDRNFALSGNTVKPSVGAGSSVMHAYDNLKNIDFEGISFQNCRFPDCNFEGSSFNKVTFTDCKLNNAVFRACRMQEVVFNHSEMPDCDFSYCQADKIKIKDCHVTYANFYESMFNACELSNTTIEKSSMIKAVWVALKADKKSHLKDCGLTQEQHAYLGNVLNVSQDPSVKRVGVVWKANWPGHTAAKIYQILKDKGVVPVKIEYDPPADRLDATKLGEQVDSLLIIARESYKKEKAQYEADLVAYQEKLANYDLAHQQFLDKEVPVDAKKPSEPQVPDSIPQRVLKIAQEHPEQYQQLIAIRDAAKRYCNQIDGLMMPGGLDLEGAIFNADYDPNVPEHHTVHTEETYHRTILEMSLISEQELRGSPFMGICRGAQLANGFYGGRTVEHVEEQVNVVQKLKAKEEAQGIIAGVIERSEDEEIKAISFHHQAMETAGYGLDEVIGIEMAINGQEPGDSSQHIIKALEGTAQQPVILTQFHPEVKEADTLNDELLNQPNTDLFDAFIDSVAARNAKQTRVLDSIRNLGNAKAVQAGAQVIRPSEVAGKTSQQVSPGVLKQITQEEFKALIKGSSEFNEVKETGSIHLKELLLQNGFSPVLDGIDLSILSITVRHPLGAGVKVIHGLERLKNVDYSGISLTNCSAEGCNFSESIFNHCNVSNCDFSKSVFEDCQFSSVKISNSVFDDANFSRSKFDKVTIENSQFNYTDFSSSHFTNTVDINQSHFEACSFVRTIDNGVSFKGTDLKDCIIPQKDKSFFSSATKEKSDPPRPVMGILWQPHQPGHTAYKLYEKLKKEGAIPLRVSYLPENEIELGLEGDGGLDADVKSALKKYDDLVRRQSPEVMGVSRAKYILEYTKKENRADSEIAKIMARAKDYCDCTDGFVIPGGADIPAELYGQAAHDKSHPEKDYMRSMIEFAVIDEQKNTGKPILGVCRGCQIINVYHGGDLNQRVYDSKLLSWLDKHKKVFSPKSRAVARYLVQGLGRMKVMPGTAGIIPGILDSSPWTVSVHNQAIDAVGDGISQGDALEIVAVHQGVVKAAQSQYGAPIMMTQFHPEISNETMKDIYQSSKAKDKILNSIGGGILMQMSSKNNLDFISAVVESARTRAKQQNELCLEIKSLQKNDLIKEGVDETPLIKPSSLKKKSNKFKKSPVPNQVKALTSRYRHSRNRLMKKRASRMPIFKNLTFRLLMFLDKNVFNRKAEQHIYALEGIASDIQSIEKQQGNTAQISESVKKLIKDKESACNRLITSFISDEPMSPLTQALNEVVKLTGRDPEVINENVKTLESTVNMEAFKSKRAIGVFLIHPNNSETILAKAILESKQKNKKIPYTPEAVFDALERYEENHCKMSKVDEEMLESVSQTTEFYSARVAQSLTQALHYRYEDMIHELKPLEKLGEDDWPRFINNLQDISWMKNEQGEAFLTDIQALYNDIRKLDAQIQDDSIPLKAELQLNKADKMLQLEEMFLSGPFVQLGLYASEKEDPFTTALMQYMNKNHGAFPATLDAWERFKATLPANIDSKMQQILSSVNSMFVAQNEDLKKIMTDYIAMHPEQPLAQAMIHHPNMAEILCQPEPFDSFLREHQLGNRSFELTEQEAELLVLLQKKQEYDAAKANMPQESVKKKSKLKSTQKAVVSVFGSKGYIAKPKAVSETAELEQRVKERSAFKKGKVNK